MKLSRRRLLQALPFLALAPKAIANAQLDLQTPVEAPAEPVEHYVWTSISLEPHFEVIDGNEVNRRDLDSGALIFEEECRTEWVKDESGMEAALIQYPWNPWRVRVFRGINFLGNFIGKGGTKLPETYAIHGHVFPITNIAVMHGPENMIEGQSSGYSTWDTESELCRLFAQSGFRPLLMGHHGYRVQGKDLVPWDGGPTKNGRPI